MVRESKREFKKKRIENSGGRREREREDFGERNEEREREKRIENSAGGSGVALLCRRFSLALLYFLVAAVVVGAFSWGMWSPPRQITLSRFRGSHRDFYGRTHYWTPPDRR